MAGLDWSSRKLAEPDREAIAGRSLLVRDPGRRSSRPFADARPWVPDSKARNQLLRSWARLTSGMTMFSAMAGARSRARSSRSASG